MLTKRPVYNVEYQDVLIANKSGKLEGGKIVKSKTLNEINSNIIYLGYAINGKKIDDIKNYIKLNDLRVQLEIGTNKTEYACDYDKRDILLTQPLREGDYIYERNKQIKACRNFKEYNITGNESWNQYTDKSDFSCIGFYLDINTKDDAKLDGKFICNSFKGSDEDVFPGSITVDDELIFVKGRSGPQSPSYIKISILKSKLSTQDIDGFKK